MEKMAASLVRAVCQAAERRYGLAPTTLLAAARLRPDEIADPSALLPAQAFYDLVRALRAITADPGVGVRIAEPVDLRQQGFFGYALLSSTTFRERVEVHVRYQRPSSPFELSFAIESGTAILSVVPHEIPADVLPIFLDFSLTSGVMHLRSHFAGDMRGVQLRVEHAERPHHAALRALLVEPIVFSAACTQLRFPAERLERKLEGDPYLADLARAQLDTSLQAERAAQPRELPDEVRRRLRARLHRNASLETVARDLRMSARTLQRQLEACGLAFHELLDDIRRGEALRYLLETSDGVELIATRLGYGDPSSFRRAFRRWTGLSPSDYRAQRRAPAEPSASQASDARPVAGKGSAA